MSDVKRRLRKRLARMLFEREQAIRDCEWWANHRSEEAPLDAEWFVVQAAGLRKALAAIERGERIDPSWVMRQRDD